ncbi:primase-helicase family protein [uncultured Maribacter sp.]|uniref:primase-helicase family protein n=1 Tax=uncultured Maribacter sp. TaxID=431308 RepID=UPI002631876F|nr:primase-helicase family protein [uncultured Maribacter sp.]
MNKINENENPQFWDYNEKGKVIILNRGLITFLEANGFVNVKLSDTNYELAKENNNRLKIVSITDVDQLVVKYLIQCEKPDVLEAFTKGVSGYLSSRKLNSLKVIEPVNDRDGESWSRFYFKNCYCEITNEAISVKQYPNLDSMIWENRLIDKNFDLPSKGKGHFEKFCESITGELPNRLLALKTALGYMLHRNKMVGESKAIILYDANMGTDNQAHGGTGKTLLSQALGKCREVVIMDGKDVKIGSWFKNQRINVTTDALIYDDLRKDISLENFYSMVTSGIEVEKKQKQSFFIKQEDSPKIMITANYPVKGPGGSSDERRRHEFELHNHYSQQWTPEMEFKKRFFIDTWGEEWNKFYLFMMECVQSYLIHGLLQPEPINLGKAKIVNETSSEFVVYAEENIQMNEWQDKREFEANFKESNPNLKWVSSHTMKKWMDAYATSTGSNLETMSSGGNYLFRVNEAPSKKTSDVR